MELEKRSAGRRERTWVRLTPAGAQALADEVGALREIIAAVEPTTASTARLRPA